MKIVTVVGARPQFVKAAAVSRKFSEYKEISEIIIHTGQHFDKNMSDIFFEEMEIPKANYFLNIHGLGHGAMTGQMLEKIEEILIKEKPDYVLVYGDTNSTLAGALAAKKLHQKVIHIEAGLRSFNMNMPEEINRILTDRISDILMCPTDCAVENLKREGFANIKCKILKSGDVMQDAAMYYSQKSESKSHVLKNNNLKTSSFILSTIHRAENTDDSEKLSSIVQALEEINKDIPVVIPMHPRTRGKLSKLKISPKFKVIDPVGYFDMIELTKNCRLVMTDSGGLQKESFFFKKNCITLRDETEWVELVEHGFNIVAGSKFNSILDAYRVMLNRINNFEVDLYGNGNACQSIVNEVINLNKN